MQNSLNIMIVEDEPLAAEKLAFMIRSRLPDATLNGPLVSVQAVVDWFAGHSDPDLIFMDIQLADGLSFEIFEKINIEVPIIFTTAFDQYAINAFQVNSIDYLLKPIDPDDLDRALHKYSRFGSQTSLPDLQTIIRALDRSKPVYKDRFVVKRGDHIRAIASREVHYFMSLHKGTWMVDERGERHLIEQSMEQLGGLLDPNRFFRINRSFILSLDAISDMISWSNSRLKIKLHHKCEEDVVVARDKVKAFKSWLEGE